MVELGTVKATDSVNSPAHYTGFSKGAEVIDIVENLAYNRGAAVKYLARAGNKQDEMEDLRKARWYVNREIERLGGTPYYEPDQTESDPEVEYPVPS